MILNDSPHSERFRALLSEVKDEVDSLKDQIESLQTKNEHLKDELANTKKREADVFSSVKGTERMALKHQIKGLVSKIDEHLEQT